MPLLLLIATILLVVGVLLVRWYAKATQKDLRKLGVVTLWVLCLTGLIILILTGRFYQALGGGLFLLLLFLIQRARQKSRQAMPSDEHEEQGSVSAFMSLDEAMDILDLDENCTEKDVKEAHRRLVQKNHPDAGGSDYLAAKINQAREVLMKYKPWRKK